MIHDNVFFQIEIFVQQFFKVDLEKFVFSGQNLDYAVDVLMSKIKDCLQYPEKICGDCYVEAFNGNLINCL